jgi:hypothetical protein
MGVWKEQQVRDKLMDAFIEADPLDVTLHRPTFVNTAAGGKIVGTTDTVAQQRFGIYPFKRRLTLEYHFTPQTYGEDKVEDIHYILIFNRNHDLEVDDYFDPEIDLVANSPAEGRLEPGIYTVTFISARLWDRGQAGIRYRGT